MRGAVERRLLSGWSVFTSPHIDLTVSQLRDENSDLSLLRCPSHSVALSPFYPSHSLFLSQGYTLKWQDLHGAR